MSTIGTIIRKRREEKGLSLMKLGQLCGVSDSAIQRIETGTHKTPNWNTLCSIARVLDIHPLEFLLVAGYITDADMHPSLSIHGLNKLNTAGIEATQLYIDYLSTRPEMTSTPKEEP